MARLNYTAYVGYAVADVATLLLPPTNHRGFFSRLAFAIASARASKRFSRVSVAS
jgi:hypothetical protein